MPTIKNRTVLEVAKNLTGFLNLDAGLTRGPAPNHQQMIKDLQVVVDEQKRRISDKDRQLTRSEERLSEALRQVREFELQISERDRQLRRVREQLSERIRQLRQAREQLPERDRQLQQAQEQLSERDRQLQQVREQLSERDQQLQQAQKRLSERSRQAQEIRKRLLDRDRQVAALQASADSSRSEPRDEELYSGLSEVLDGIPIDLGGGCSLDKAYLMAWLIRRYDLKRTVDIGVYRGRSLFPQALAHTRFTGGVVYGVDPYSASEATEENIESADKKDKDAVNRFMEQTDWEAICRSVVSTRDELGYGDHCVLLRETSAAAADFFEDNAVSFGMVHVDGNHDTDKVMKDLELYLPRVEKDGFILLDDISFTSVRPAYEKLKASTTLVYERADQDDANDFAVFQNGPQPPNAGYNRRLWARDFW